MYNIVGPRIAPSLSTQNRFGSGELFTQQSYALYYTNDENSRRGSIIPGLKRRPLFEKFRVIRVSNKSVVN